MLGDERKAQFIQKAHGCGADVYFLAPVTFPALSANSRGIGTDPFAQLPGVTCVIALIWGYSPMVKRENPQISAYYIASNRGHFCADELLKWLREQGAAATMADLPVRHVLQQANLAQIGKNGLAAMQGTGSFFYGKLILTDAFAPKEHADLRVPCQNCGKCAQACPASAIGESFDPYRCVRHFLDGQVLDEQTKKRMTSLLGCEVCQRVCPRNAQISAIPAPDDVERLFSFESLLETYPKKELAALVGKNMLSRGRLRAQAFALAQKANNGSFCAAAKALVGDDHPCLANAAAEYLCAFLHEEKGMP